MQKMVSLNVRIDGYTNRVLGVIKEKYGLKDKAQALNKFADMYGDEFIEKEVDEEVAKSVIESCNRHIKKYGFRNRSMAEIRKKIEAK